MTNEEIFDIRAPLNQERKFNHEECGDRRERLYVRRTEKGWIYNCFNCGSRGFKKPSATEYLQSRNWLSAYIQRDRHTNGEFQIPIKAPFTREARAWLDKYEITEEEQERYGIYYTTEWGGRIVLPVYSTTSLRMSENISEFCSGFQLRLLSGKGPKYITAKRNKAEPLRFLSIPRGNTPKEIVIVEDILSAIKVGRECQALSLLGSPNILPDDVGKWLQSRPGNIAFWLDPDKIAGSFHYAQRYNSLYNQGQNVVAIQSDKDPKDYSDEEITFFLHRAFGDGII